MALSYFCPHCGKHFDTPGICPICQVSLLPHSQTASSANRYCTQCGTPVSLPEQLFCTSCGAPLTAPAAHQDYGNSPQKKKFPVLGIAGIVLGIFLIFCVAAAVFLSGFGLLFQEKQDTGLGQWYHEDGGYTDSYDKGGGPVHTNARALIVSLTYGTGEEFGCIPAQGEFVEIGLNIINTQDRTITLTLSNFYLTEDATGKKISPYSESEGETPIRVDANDAVAGAIAFEINPEGSYHLHFVESDGTVISSYELSK